MRGAWNAVVVLAVASFARFYCVTWLGERVVAVVSLDSSRPIVLGTEQGIVATPHSGRSTSAAVPLAAASFERWPSRPKPVTSVAA